MTKLLVVDDNRFYRARLAELFAADGHDVETAGDAATAIATARTFHPDVLVIDRMLRDDRDGFDVAKLLQEESPKLKTIVITGYPSMAVESQARELEVFAFFEKPFDPQELCESVRRAADAASEQGR